MKNRTSEKEISKLKKNEIFVFGSNAEGKHEGGAAKLAHKKFGAKMGVGRGLTGNCYAIDSMSGLDILKEQIDPFISVAMVSKDKVFLVTEIGCGIAGYTVEQIAPLFSPAKDVENIHLPESFWKHLIEQPVIAYKAFNEDFSCRGFKYEVGKEYEHEGRVKICESGFHACENPLDVLNYYDITSSKFAVVEMSKDVQRHSDDSKVASKKIKIKAELSMGDFIKASVDFVFGSWFKKAISESSTEIENASSGNYSQNASSGNYSKNASSGDNSKNASSGNYSKNASSGDNSKNASSGYNSQNASSGDNSQNASSGDNSKNASSGNYSQNASSGNYSQNASSGNYSKNASSGNYSQNASSGNYSKNASSGYNSKNASSGNYSKNASSGDNSQNASSGDNSQNASSGYNSTIEMTGQNNVGAAIGKDSRIKGIIGSLVCLVHYSEEGVALGWVTGKIGEGDLKEDTWYEVKDGKFSEVK